MELGAYEWIEAPTVAAYEHLGNKLATIIGLTAEGIDPYVGKEVAMQVAAMNPVAATRGQVPHPSSRRRRTWPSRRPRRSRCRRPPRPLSAKAGLNPNHFDSEDHIASNVAKGWLTEEAAEKGRAIMKEAAEKKAANIPQAVIDNIVNGRINKYYKENVLVEQEYHRDAKLTVGQYLEQTEKGLTVAEFRRVNLNQD